MRFVRLASVWLTILAASAGCGRIFGFDDAYPIPDASQDEHVCTAQGLVCSGTVTMTVCGTGCWVSCDEAVSETTAAARCAAASSKLAPLRISDDQECLRHTVVPTGDVWIGLEQGATASSVGSSWSWNGDGLNLGFANWMPGQPDDGDHTENGAEQCAMITNGASTWNDTSCSMTLPFTCRRTFEN